MRDRIGASHSTVLTQILFCFVFFLFVLKIFKSELLSSRDWIIIWFGKVCAGLWALPTPQMFLVAGSARNLSHVVSNCDVPQRLSFQVLGMC